MLDTPLKDVLRTTTRHINKLKEIGLRNVSDFLTYFPRTYNDHSETTKIADIRTNQVSTVRGTLSQLFMKRTKYGKYLILGTLKDETGIVQAVWFNQPHIKRVF